MDASVVNILLKEAIEKYFNKVSKSGYIADKNVFSILVLDYISDIYSIDLSKEQLDIINNTIECLQGSCLISTLSCNRI